MYGWSVEYMVLIQLNLLYGLGATLREETIKKNKKIAKKFIKSIKKKSY